MRFLLDTHAFLWFLLADPQLSPLAKLLIEDPRHEIEISPASYWEVAIKIQIGKYSLPVPYDQFIESQIELNAFHILHIEPRHTSLLTTLPLHHKDPFDRLLVSQALAEKIPILSRDEAFDAYGVQRVW